MSQLNTLDNHTNLVNYNWWWVFPDQLPVDSHIAI